MSEHSVIPSSSAHIWGAPDGCTGWVEMMGKIPEPPETEASREGDAFHEYIAEGARLARQHGHYKHLKMDVASNGVVIDDEMRDAAVVYLDDAISVMRSFGVFSDTNVMVEHRVHAPRIHVKQFGTVDLAIYDAVSGYLYIYDAKYGHVPVDAFENWQLICYAAGLLEEIDERDEDIVIIFKIVQPRAHKSCGPIDTWRVRASDIRGHINILRNRATIALGEAQEKPTTSSGAHCRYCAARQSCAAALRGAASLYEVATQPTAVDMSPEQLGVQYAIIKRAEEQIVALAKAFDEQVNATLKQGKRIPGWTTEQTSGRKRWNKPVSEVLALGKLLGHDLSKNDVITPTQAAKLGIDPKVISCYSERASGGVKVVKENPAKINAIFKS